MFNRKIYICADMHGSAQSINSIISQIKNPSSEDVIIVAGDAGFEYQDCIMGSAKRASKQFPGYWIVMRGNHDSSYWKEHTHIENDIVIPDQGWDFQYNGFDVYLYQKKYPRILYVEDSGGIYTIGKYNFLFLPGAYSVDKEIRLMRGYPYNPTEQLTLQEQCDLLLITEGWNECESPIDYVIGHTFPLKMEPYYDFLFLDFIDQTNVDKSTEEWLDTMSRIYEKNYAFKYYFGGHMHADIRLDDKYIMVYQKVVDIDNYKE